MSFRGHIGNSIVFAIQLTVVGAILYGVGSSLWSCSGNARSTSLAQKPPLTIETIAPIFWREESWASEGNTAYISSDGGAWFLDGPQARRILVDSLPLEQVDAVIALNGGSAYVFTSNGVYFATREVAVKVRQEPAKPSQEAR